LRRLSAPFEQPLELRQLARKQGSGLPRWDAYRLMREEDQDASQPGTLVKEIGVDV
jgi:hypothetical protein